MLAEAFDMIINTPGKSAAKTTPTPCLIIPPPSLIIMIMSIDDDAGFGAKIYKWSETAGTLLTCVVRESLLSSNDLSPSLKRLAVRHACKNNSLLSSLPLRPFPLPLPLPPPTAATVVVNYALSLFPRN